MIILRPFYLNQLIAAKGNRMIKIITGIRRCGKSFLLFEIFCDYLNSIGVDEDHIIKISIEDRANKELRNPDKLLSYINERIVDKEQYYILLDEVQMVEDFVGVLNSLLLIRNADTYVTGSNSRFLSSDIVTEFRGRGQDIHMYPLSFSEYYNSADVDKNTCWRDYYTYGGLPQTLFLSDGKARRDYLNHLANTVYIADVVERHRIQNKPELDELLQILASMIGSPCNPTKLSNTFKSIKNINISNKTISKYLSHLCDSFLIEKSLRYNIKGKKYINTLAKYYFTDVGIRNALLGFRQLEQTHLMENIIYNELLYRGYTVDVGVVDLVEKNRDGKSIRKQLEVDFVATDSFTRYYIQSAFAIPNEEKMKQETNSFRNINDSFKRIIIVKDDLMPYQNKDGILIVGLFDFLLNPELFSQF
ncbi:MAG: ATP-binding protein [Muribaculaceae bacterium]|nr:ATP-binding protein [Muribaculaceae bacterium]